METFHGLPKWGSWTSRWLAPTPPYSSPPSPPSPHPPHPLTATSSSVPNILLLLLPPFLTLFQFPLSSMPNVKCIGKTGEGFKDRFIWGCQRRDGGIFKITMGPRKSRVLLQLVVCFLRFQQKVLKNKWCYSSFFCDRSNPIHTHSLTLY